MAELLTLKSQRGATKGCMTRIKTLIEQKAGSLTAIELECRLGILESYFKQILSYQISIEKLTEQDESELKIRGELEDIYCSTKSKILSLLSERRPSTPNLDQSVINVQAPAVSHLPKLKLPQFTGKYSEFSNFYKIFDNLVDKDTSLSTIERFNHLLSCLSGPALRAVKALDVTESNYPKALKCLKDRYDNKVLIFQEHVNELLNLPKVPRNSASHLRSLVDNVSAHLNALQSLGTFEEIANAMIVQLANARLDADSQTKWEESIDYSKPLKWEDCAVVLSRRCQYLEARETKIGSSDADHSNQRSNKSKSSHHHRHSERTSLTITKTSCLYCKRNDHLIYQCGKFSELTVLDRFKEAKKLALCINCLAKGHSVKSCTSSKCRVCGNPHHTLLHRYNSDFGASNSKASCDRRLTAIDTKAEISSDAQIIGTSLPSAIEFSNVDNPDDGQHTFIATAIIEVKDSCGIYHPARALLDSASHLNFITQHMVQRLKLKKERVQTNVSGIGEVCTEVRHATYAKIRSRLNDYDAELKLLVLPSITEMQPEHNVNIADWNIPSNITLADPFFNKSQKIDLLIGADKFFEILSVGQIKLGENMPILQKTLFGWIVSGKYAVFRAKYKYNSFSAMESSQMDNNSDESLEEIVQKFWETEALTNSSPWTEEQISCELSFKEHTRRKEDGRFIVKLPFKDDPRILGDSLDAARRRFGALERKLSRNPNMKEQYADFLEEYEKLNHMELASFQEMPNPHFVMPHRCVERPDSSTTKLRVVFDASCKTTSQKSLNDVLMIGPTIQDDLYSIILRFRSYRFALTADISAMYRQIEVQPEDMAFQYIIWRRTAEDELKTYKLRTVTYGTASAPFLATRCLKYLADEIIESSPKISEIIRHDFYMDDLISGADNSEDLMQIKSQVETVLQGGQFKLRKWFSNDFEFLKTVSEEDREKTLRLNDLDVIKTLGVMWNPTSDELCFTYRPWPGNSQKTTKRTVLAQISRLYDPLGIINPVVVKAKIFLQELWILGLNWDESLPQALETQWNCFTSHLNELSKVKLPRFLLSATEVSRVEVHGFSDASIRAYGCCIYIRCIDVTNNIIVNLYTAKSKVAPARLIRSLPCLELCAANLLAELWNKVKGNIRFKYNALYFWTDSVIVLDWLSAHPSTWKTFVANRVSNIQQLTQEGIWRYVNSKANSADIISRGALVSEMLSSIWFTGPEFLYKDSGHWPTRSRGSTDSKDLPERRGKSSVLACTTTPSFLDIVYKISCFSQNCRRFAIVLRFYKILVKKTVRPNGNFEPITASEFEEAFMRIIWAIQNTEFIEEISSLKRGLVVNSNSQVKSLNPFLDSQGELPLLRVGGRLKQAKLPYEARCPILLPKDNPFILSYIRYLHLKNFHAGSQALLAFIHQRFWIIGGRNYARKVVKECIHCFRYKPTLLQQIMGDLPENRITPAKPFAYCGVDFCGPISTILRVRGKTFIKSYIALFICFVTKAVHLEVVSNLTSDAFIAALKRFTARRGLCKKLYCDNATNFVGARRQLAEFREAFLDQQYQQNLANWCAENYIEISHIPPRSPHFGGLWEAAIKAAKAHLYRTLQAAVLTFEELTTVAAQIEGILNSRPITPLTSDPSDENVLTPNHFLNPTMASGEMHECILEPQIKPESLSYLKKWQQLTVLQQHFCRRWSKEYLVILQQRFKWQKSSPNISIGTMVLVHEDNLPPQKWLLGRIVAIIHGRDNKVRVADVKTKAGTIRRSISKLAPLPISN